MSKSVLISIRPQYCELIASGKKTIEVRKTRPKLETPFKCYIYCTLKPDNANNLLEIHAEDGKIRRANGKVIGEFVCDEILDIYRRGIGNNFDYCYESLNVFGNDDIEPYITAIRKSCISEAELNAYGNNAPQFYGWHISALQIYDKPRELSEFFNYCKDSADCVKCCFFDKSFNPCDDGTRCRVDEKKPITRAPMSWCYVEEYDGKR